MIQRGGEVVIQMLTNVQRAMLISGVWREIKKGRILLN
jgi:hypothetical protein